MLHFRGITPSRQNLIPAFRVCKSGRVIRHNIYLCCRGDSPAFKHLNFIYTSGLTQQELRCPSYCCLSFKYLNISPRFVGICVLEQRAWPSSWFIHEVHWGRPLKCMNNLKLTLFHLFKKSILIYLRIANFFSLHQMLLFWGDMNKVFFGILRNPSESLVCRLSLLLEFFFVCLFVPFLTFQLIS